jgi:hypothetical protein
MELNASASLTLQVSGGPSISIPWSIAADAFERSTVKIPKNTAKLDVLLQPAGGDKILLLVVTATKYADTLLFSFDAGTTNYKMNNPQVVSGGDLMKSLNATPTTVSFKNSGAEDITVDMLVLRRA